jgi:plastocyanin
MLAIGLGTLAIGVPGLGCGSDDSEPDTDPEAAPPESAAGGEVTAVDFAFEPEATEIEAGESVTWSNDGATIHNVKGKGFFSEAIDPGASYEHRFTEPGTYEYLCNLHPDQMRGTVVVAG